MPRRRAAQHCTIVPWLSAKADNAEGRFIQVGNSFLLSKRVQRLSSGAIRLYLCMANEAAGHRDFIFPLAAAKKYGFAPASFRRYVNELVKEKFIVISSSGQVVREPNKYEFCLDWKLERGAQ